MMHRTGDYGFGENDKMQLLSAPYKGDELSMIFVLPRNKNGLGDVEKAALVLRTCERRKTPGMILMS